MAIVYEIEHITRYQYPNPVTLGEHRAAPQRHRRPLGTVNCVGSRG